MALTDVDDPGLLVLPTHRLLFGLSRDALSLLTSQQLTQYFTVYELGAIENAQEALLRLPQGDAKKATFFVHHPPHARISRRNNTTRTPLPTTHTLHPRTNPA